MLAVRYSPAHQPDGARWRQRLPRPALVLPGHMGMHTALDLTCGEAGCHPARQSRTAEDARRAGRGRRRRPASTGIARHARLPGGWRQAAPPPGCRRPIRPDTNSMVPVPSWQPSGLTESGNCRACSTGFFHLIPASKPSGGICRSSPASLAPTCISSWSCRGWRDTGMFSRRPGNYGTECPAVQAGEPSSRRPNA